MYNIAFPVIILVPLIFVLVVLFIVPVEKAILLLPMVKMGQLGNSVGLHDYTRPGILTTK